MPNVIRIPNLPIKKNRLTAEDRKQAWLWAGGSVRRWCRIAIWADPAEDEEIGDYISIYRLHAQWASWGAARRDQEILLWRSDCGKDIGMFPSMLQALNTIFDSRLDASFSNETLATLTSP